MVIKEIYIKSKSIENYSDDLTIYIYTETGINPSLSHKFIFLFLLK